MIPEIDLTSAGDRFDTSAQSGLMSKKAASLPLRLLFVGNVIRRKGVHTLIEAVAQLPNKAWSLDVAGSLEVEPDYAQKWLRDMPNALDIQAQITLHNSVDGETLAALYAQSDLLVMPSQYEGYGIVYLEGMGFGCPAVGTRSGAAHEIITDGKDGFLIEAGDTAVLHHHLLTLINTPEQRQKMSQAARARFLRHPSWQESMAKIEGFLVGFSNIGNW